MRLGINACNYNARPAGATNKFVGLYTHLFEQFQELEYVVFEPCDADIRSMFAPYPHVRFVKTPLSSVSRGQRYRRGLNYWRRALVRERIDAFETAYFPAVINSYGSTLLTIHDLRYRHFPGLGPAIRRIVGDRVVRTGIRRSDVLITISHAMKREIEERYSPEIPVEVLPPALPLSYGEKFMDGPALEVLRQRYGLDRPFILTVGHLERRKNFVTLARAFQLMSGTFDGKLIIVGNPADDAERLKKFVKANGLGSRVQCIQHISDSDLAGFYQLCSLFVFPSLYEGFGIPLLEAMHFGRPYVASNIEVFKEVTGHRGMYFDPTSAEDMANVMTDVLGSGSKQEDLRQLGLERLKCYDYGETARKYEALLKSISPGRRK